MSNEVHVKFPRFLPILFLVFLVLKLTDVIDWSWWWVTCPLWIEMVLFLIVAFIVIIVALCESILRAIKEAKSNRFKRR